MGLKQIMNMENNINDKNKYQELIKLYHDLILKEKSGTNQNITSTQTNKIFSLNKTLRGARDKNKN